MPLIKRALFILSLVIFSGICGHAEEAHEAAKPSETKEGEGKGAIKSNLPGWVELENKIQETQSKMRSKQANINSLIVEKNRLADNTSELKNVVKDIVKEHAELRKLGEEYDKNVNLLKYRFPERNAKSNRTYDRIEVKSIDEMEQSLGVDGKLNRNLKQMRTHYHLRPPVEPKEQSKSKPSKKTPSADPSIEDSGSVLLQK